VVHVPPPVVRVGLPCGMWVTFIFQKNMDSQLSSLCIGLCFQINKFSCSLLLLLYHNIMTFDALLANLHHASTNWWKENKTKISLKLVVVFYCYFNVYYSSAWTNIKLVVLEEVVRIDNTGAQVVRCCKKVWNPWFRWQAFWNHQTWQYIMCLSGSKWIFSISNTSNKLW